MKKTVCCILALCLMLAQTLSALAQGGSWGQINQPIERPDGWTRYVHDDCFVLGERQAAGEAGGVPLYRQAWGSYPSLDGSTVCVPMAMELARQHLNMQEQDLSGFVAFSTTHAAYERLIGAKPNPTVSIVSQNTILDETHPVDLLLATEPSDEELAMAADAGVELATVPFCYDAFVFIVNADNPVQSLTVAQIRDIYTGSTRQWGDVGGREGDAIIPYQREKNSGSQTAMENLVMQGVALAAAQPNHMLASMGELVGHVGDYDNGVQSLGYTYLYYVDTLYKSGQIKVLRIDGIAPTPDALRSGAYPFGTCYYAVYRRGDEAAAAFAEWLQSPEGQRCVRQAGYIPYVEPEE